ncbi:MAG: bacteriohemerythrin [Euryarchaeota archaeon]|nr:bacteriohemerythrin [Euryarchaeota archaeon]
MVERKCIGGIAFSKMEFVKEKYGDEGLKRMLEEMKKMGYDGPGRPEDIKLVKWYPFEHNLVFLRAFMNLFGKDAYRRMARGSFKREERFKMFIGWARTPEGIITNAGEYWHKFFNFGEFHGEMLGEGRARLVGRDIYVDPLFCEFLTEYFAGLLESAGAAGVRVQHTACAGSGAKECVWDVRWRATKVDRSISWSPALETGIEEIDRQHRYFVKILNDINSSISENYRSAFLRALRFMDHYAHWHFGSEEKYMKMYDYPQYEEHCKEHEKFYEYTQSIMNKAELQGITPALAYEVDKYLVDWLIAHIKGTDRRFAEFLKSRKLSMPEEQMPDEIKENIKG